VKVQRLRPDVDGTDGALFGSALLLLFACCANVGNLVLARRESRRHETAIRGAIGADRRDLFTDDAAEAVVLAAAAFAAGLLLAMVGTGVLVQWAAPARPPRWDTIAFGAPTVLFALAVSVGSAVVVMAIGSLRRTPDSAMLRDAWRGAAVTRPAPVLHFVLGAGQVALALVVATGAGLTLRTAYSILGTEPGVRTDGVLTFEVHLPPSYQSGEAVAEFHRGLATELMALRDIEAVGAASLLPLVGVAPGVCTPMLPVGSATDESCVVAGIASPGFFETLAMRVRGQTPAWTEPGTAVITDNLARRLWPGQDPIGREFRLGDGPTHRVTGVLETLRTVIHEPPVEAVYVSVLGAPGAPPRMTYSAVVVRTSGADPMAIYPAVRRVLSRLDPSIAPGNVRTMDDIALIVTRRFTFMFSVLAVAAAVCLVLCAIGVFGVVAHIAGRRRHEIGVRIALGAGLADIRRAVAGRSYRFTAVGLGLGLIGSLAATPVLTGMLHGVRPIDGPVWIAAAALVCGTALFAAWLPANRAARLSPRDALFTD
jgi:predicted permease